MVCVDDVLVALCVYIVFHPIQYGFNICSDKEPWLDWSYPRVGLVINIIGFSLNALRRRSGSNGDQWLSLSAGLLAQLAEH